MKKYINNGNIRFLAFIFTLIASIVAGAWSLSAQNQKLETNILEQAKIREKTEVHGKDIAELKTDIKYIRKGIDEIKRKL